MSVRHEARFMCDRCKIDDVRRQNENPPGWVQANVVYMDRSSRGDPLVFRAGMLCQKCRDSFEEWWRE